MRLRFWPKFPCGLVLWLGVGHSGRSGHAGPSWDGCSGHPICGGCVKTGCEVGRHARFHGCHALDGWRGGVPFHASFRLEVDNWSPFGRKKGVVLAIDVLGVHAPGCSLDPSTNSRRQNDLAASSRTSRSVGVDRWIWLAKLVVCARGCQGSPCSQAAWRRGWARLLASQCCI